VSHNPKSECTPRPINPKYDIILMLVLWRRGVVSMWLLNQTPTDTYRKAARQNIRQLTLEISYSREFLGWEAYFQSHE